MKKIILIFALLSSTFVVAQDKYDLLMLKMGVINDTKTFVNNYIDRLASESNGINTAQWATIKNEIDYSAYFISVKSILTEHYTTSEIDEIFASNDMIAPINDTGKFIYKPKPEVREKLYKMSRAFGKMVNTQRSHLDFLSL